VRYHEGVFEGHGHLHLLEGGPTLPVRLPGQSDLLQHVLLARVTVQNQEGITKGATTYLLADIVLVLRGWRALR
jgi:hypothetical protein